MTRGGKNRAEIFSPIKGAKKMKYTITIEETVSDTFEVEANSLKEATEKAIQNYNEAIFVLEPGNVTATHMQAVSKDEKEDSDWFEF